MTGLVCPHCDAAFDSDKRLSRADVTACKLCDQKFVVTQKTLKAYQKPVAAPIQPLPPNEPTSQPVQESIVKINCPHCTTELQGQIFTGQIVKCSECHRQFEATPERLNNVVPVLARAAPMPTADSRKPKSIAGKLALIFLGLMALFVFIMPDSKEATTTNNAAPDVAQQKPVPAQPARDPNAPESFLSAWDGSNRELVKLVKSAMNDPKSFEHVETRFVDRGNSLSLFMTYRGKNAFGGVVTNKVSAELDKNTRSLSNIQER